MPVKVSGDSGATLGAAFVLGRPLATRAVRVAYAFQSVPSASA
jgi:hypothetical protein